MERRIGFLDGVSGHTYDTIFDLLFTSERVIALLVQHPAEVEYKFGVTELLFGGLLNKSKDRFEKRFEKRNSVEERSLNYGGKTFEELLAGHRFNFEIPYDMVRSVEITKGLFQSRLKFYLNDSSPLGPALQFTLSKDQILEAQELLNGALPLKFTGKK